jgi:hypothetical protein
METPKTPVLYVEDRPSRGRLLRTGVAALGLFGAGLVLGLCVLGSSGSDVPSRGLISDLAASLPKPREQHGEASDAKKGCNEHAAYWSTRLIYNNLGLTSLLAGLSSNAVKWRFSHTSCGPAPDYSCFTFINTDCHFDGCSWYEATTFTCESQLHGETFVFLNVHDNCEVWQVWLPPQSAVPKVSVYLLLRVTSPHAHLRASTESPESPAAKRASPHPISAIGRTL